MTRIEKVLKELNELYEFYKRIPKVKEPRKEFRLNQKESKY